MKISMGTDMVNEAKAVAMVKIVTIDFMMRERLRNGCTVERM